MRSNRRRNLSGLGENEKAIEHYRKAIEDHLLHLSSYIRIGSIYLQSGQFEMAIREWKALGITLEKWKKYGHLIDEYALFATIRQSYNQYEKAYLYHLISKAYIELLKSEGKPIPAEVIDYAEKSVEITRGRKAQFLVTLAELYYLNKEIDRAIMNMEKAINAEKDKGKREQMAQMLILYKESQKRNP